VKVVFGAMTLGKEGAEQVRVHDLEEAGRILDVFQKYGHNEIDTAYTYTNGTSEEYLGKIDHQKRGIVVDTKLHPRNNGEFKITHSPADLRKFLEDQLKKLNTTSIDMWYFHGPDRTVPYEDSMRTVNELYKEGKFKRFGLSNYQSWEVAYIVCICDKNGWIKPTAYQGVYNAIHRVVEPELFPCLRKFGLSFYAFNPLAGGFFTGRFSRDAAPEPGSRFDPTKPQGQNYRARYWKEEYWTALDLIQAVATKYSLTLAEIALRWMNHHSLLKKEYGDNVLMGASSTAHLEQNLIDLEKGPLPEEVVTVLDQAWELVRPVASKYWH